MRSNKKEEFMGKVVDIILENLSIPRERITPEKSIVDDLGADSLDVATILGEIEDKFEIEIPENETREIDTVEQLVDYIIRKK